MSILAQAGMDDIQLPGMHGPLPGNQVRQMTEFLAQQMKDVHGNPIPNLNMQKGPLDIILSSERTNMSPPLLPSKYLTLPQFPVGFVDFQVNQSKHKIAPSKQVMGYLSVPPRSPVDFLKVPNWPKKGPQVPGGHEHALGLVVNGPVIEGKPPPMPVDPVHHLPMNHLFVPVPITHLKAQTDIQQGKN